MIKAVDITKISTERDLARIISAYLEEKGFKDGSREFLDGVLKGRIGLSTLITAISENKNWLSRIASRSYAHNNGFDKIVLVDNSSGQLAESRFNLRMHIWWKDREKVLEGPHDHAWLFSSLILAGAIKASEFLVTGGRSYHFYEFILRPGKISAGSIYKGKVSLIPNRQTTYKAGEIYTLPMEIIHSVERVNNITAITLVVQGPILAKSCSLFATKKLGKNKLNKIPFIGSRLEEKFKRVLREIDQ